MSTKNNKRRFMFEIPNNKEGEYFVYLVNKFLNKETYTMRKKSRGKRASKARKDGLSPRSYDSYLPMKHAERLQLYFDSALRDDTVDYLRKQIYSDYETKKRLETQIKNNAENLDKFNQIKRILG